jgi:MoxR-like ATPase
MSRDGMKEVSWAREHRERQERLFAAMQQGLLSENTAEFLDEIDNAKQKMFNNILKGR